MENKPVILLGAGGHATVLLDVLTLVGANVLGYLDKSSGGGGDNLRDVPFLGVDEEVRRFSPTDILLVNGIGSVGKAESRREIFLKFRAWGYHFRSVIHPTATISNWARMGEGVQVMAGAVVGANVTVGDNVIINTRATVDHDCHLASHVHIAPGAVLSGMVQVGESAHIGTGAAVKQGVRIGERAIVGVGSAVVHDISVGAVAYGCPARVR